jgi:hypothetical protein
MIVLGKKGNEICSKLLHVARATEALRPGWPFSFSHVARTGTPTDRNGSRSSYPIPTLPGKTATIQQPQLPRVDGTLTWQNRTHPKGA